MSIYKTLSSKGVTRRGFIKGAGAIAGGAAAALTVPASVRSAFAQGDDVIRVGFIGPRSGPLGVFGVAALDPRHVVVGVLGRVR